MESGTSHHPESMLMLAPSPCWASVALEPIARALSVARSTIDVVLHLSTEDHILRGLTTTRIVNMPLLGHPGYTDQRLLNRVMLSLEMAGHDRPRLWS